LALGWVVSYGFLGIGRDAIGVWAPLGYLGPYPNYPQLLGVLYCTPKWALYIDGCRGKFDPAADK